MYLHKISPMLQSVHWQQTTLSVVSLAKFTDSNAKLKLLCMLLLSECDPPCANGTCSTVIGVCQCDDGFIGTACDAGKDNTDLKYMVWVL